MRFGVSPSGAVRPCFPGFSLEINEVANLHAKSLCDAIKHAYADVGFSKLDSRYVGLALRAADHEGKLVLRQLLLQTEFTYFHTELL